MEQLLHDIIKELELLNKKFDKLISLFEQYDMSMFEFDEETRNKTVEYAKRGRT